MAGDWIKMRVSLAKDPAVIAMADYLAEQRAFMDWLTDPVRKSCNETAYEHVTRNVTVAVTVSALLVFWGVANEVGKPDGDDLVMRHATLDIVDEASGVPGFGDAMAYVEWAVEEESSGKHSIRLPKFLINNVPAGDRSKTSNAERQRRYRERHSVTCNAGSNVTRNVTVTHREEKKREEKKDKKTTPVGDLLDGVDRQVAGDFTALRNKLRAPITKTALDGIRREAEKAGISLDRALAMCCERGWRGFKAEWVSDQRGNGAAEPPMMPRLQS